MSIAKNITVKKHAWGGETLFTPFPSHGDISIYGSIVGGERVAEHQELAYIHALMLLEGTRKRSKKDIQEFLDTLGASLHFGVTADRLVFSARVRAKHADKMCALIAEILKDATFPTKELETLKSRRSAELALEAQNTRMQAGILLARSLYTETHPNWENTTEESALALASITRKELQGYHAYIAGKDSLIMSIAGDIAKTKALALTEKYFRTVPIGTPILPPITAEQTHRPSHHTTQIPEKVSIDYIAGITTGIDKNHADYAALMLGVQILGNRSGFTGRLMKRVREQEGLTYGVYSYLAGFENSVDGYVMAWATFAPELFKKGRSAVLREIRLIVEKGVTSFEVTKHKTMYEARSRVSCTNSTELARAAHDVVAGGHRPSFLDTFPKHVLSLTPSQVNKALKKYLLPDLLTEVAAGPIDTKAFTH